MIQFIVIRILIVFKMISDRTPTADCRDIYVYIQE